jgi:membrane fusion protein (multidrug efflux system)
VEHTEGAEPHPARGEKGNEPAADGEPHPDGAGKEPDGPDGHDGDEEAHEPKAPLPVRLRAWQKKHPRAAIALAVLAVALVVGGVLLWLWLRTFEDTDDAQIDGHIASVSARISGNVAAVHVDDNLRVKEGQLLLELDPRDYQVAVATAEAELAQAEAQLAGAAPEVPITKQSNETRVSSSEEDVTNAEAALSAAVRDHDGAEAAVREAQAAQQRAATDLARYKYLVGQHAVPQEKYDQIVETAKTTTAALDSASAQARARAKAVEQAQARLAQAQSRSQEASRNAPHQLFVQRANIAAREAAVRAARSALEQARLNLSYTRIVAPYDGIVGRRSVEPGNHIAPGQEMLALVDMRELYVTANFKETQLHPIRLGQHVRVHVDALGRDFDGWVDSFGAASGSRFSLLPPENATGNYVKVVQRLPMRLRINPNQPGADQLRPGMSVEPKVYIR